jgi:hypothetical protein
MGTELLILPLAVITGRIFLLEVAMQRNYQSSSSFNSQFDLTNQTAFHEAGHASSIYLGNKAKQLPPVYFKIQIKKPAHSDDLFIAKVIDGRLIQNLPIAGLENTHSVTNKEQLIYQSAYEADVVNLLVGPLAEAKYVSIRDDEALSFNLLNTYALNYYGGSSDVKNAYNYLEYFILSKAEREEKMLELFSEAFEFIENRKNWECILSLAHYILDSKKDVISCEEAIEVLNNKSGAL